MKGTDHFKRTIYMYLEQRAEEDALFAKKYRNPAKNMDEGVTHPLITSLGGYVSLCFSP